MGTAVSRDGTSISFETAGAGPLLIFIDAAGHFRANSSLGDLADLLSDRFTVLRYDRRGRGLSTDAAAYEPAREVDDIAALIDAVDSPAALYGYSSGCLLAAHAVAAGLPINRLVLFEPPLEPDSRWVDSELAPVAAVPLPEGDDLVRSLVTFLTAGMRSAPPPIVEDRS